MKTEICYVVVDERSQDSVRRCRTLDAAERHARAWSRKRGGAEVVQCGFGQRKLRSTWAEGEYLAALDV